MSDTGYEIIMRHMKTNPEVFVIRPYQDDPWVTFARVLLDPDKSRGFITDAQREELGYAHTKIQREAFDVEVMKHLMGVGGRRWKQTQEEIREGPSSPPAATKDNDLVWFRSMGKRP